MSTRIEGLGFRIKRDAPCDASQLRRIWDSPAWIYTLDEENLDRDLAVFAHEFIHAWTAWLSYEKEGEPEPLFGNYCACHWRPDLHTPAAFPWHGAEAQSIMAGGSGRFWRDNRDGTYTSLDNYRGGGPSWLDLYAMGLADADEVPDMFILRNLEVIDGAGYCSGGRYCSGTVWTGDKEIVSIEQIIAAEGPREPSAAESQKVFNAGFVYLSEPGQTPSSALLDLHAKYLTAAKEYWSHITGGRSLITTNVDGMADATLENPRSGSFQSGVAAISGWACDAQEIIIELNGVPYRAGYPTTRGPDTLGRCGDTDNGFSLLWNWNNLGAGTHTVRALLDGAEFATTTVCT